MITIFLGTDNIQLRFAVESCHTAYVLTFPEQHFGGTVVHPSKHAAIADDIIGRGDVAVCTHSETVVLRVRRRIAESSLKPENVSLVWVEPDGTTKPIRLDAIGNLDWWPEVDGVPVWTEDFAEVKAIHRAQRARGVAMRERGET